MKRGCAPGCANGLLLHVTQCRRPYTSTDLETEIAEEIRRQLANARSNQTSGEVAQRHETVLSNIMLPGQADIEPGEPLDTGTASTTAVPPPADNGQSVTTEEETQAIAPVTLPKMPVDPAAGHADAPLPGNSTAPAPSSSLLPEMGPVAIERMIEPVAATAATDSQSVAAPELTPPAKPTTPDAPDVNHAPTAASIADQTADEDAGFTFTVPSGTFTDSDAGDQLTYTATLSDGSPLPAWLTFDPVTQTFSGTPGNDDIGNISIRLTATDLHGASATQTFTVTVDNTNDAPVVSAQIADQAATEDSGFTFSLPLVRLPTSMSAITSPTRPRRPTAHRCPPGSPSTPPPRPSPAHRPTAMSATSRSR